MSSDQLTLVICCFFGDEKLPSHRRIITNHKPWLRIPMNIYEPTSVMECHFWVLSVAQMEIHKSFFGFSIHPTTPQRTNRDFLEGPQRFLGHRRIPKFPEKKADGPPFWNENLPPGRGEISASHKGSSWFRTDGFIPSKNKSENTFIFPNPHTNWRLFLPTFLYPPKTRQKEFEEVN